MPKKALAGIALLVFVLGLGVGVLVAMQDPKDSDEYKHAMDLIEQKNAALLQGVDALEQADVALSTIEGDLPDREAAVSEAEVKLNDRDAALDRRERRLQADVDAVEKREKAVGIIENEIARNTIPGEGVYRVGQDMNPGTYRSTGGVGGRSCYWSINADANGADIINNGIGAGPAIVTVSQGQFFETSSCRDWILQR